MARICRPVHLKDPTRTPEPEPVAGCDVCVALAQQRARADAMGDKSRATDCTIEIRRHPHPQAGLGHVDILTAARPARTLKAAQA